MSKPLVDELGDYPQDCSSAARTNFAYAGPVADEFDRLQRRIDELERRLEEVESRPVPNARVQAGALSVDTRPGLSVSDVIELARELRRTN